MKPILFFILFVSLWLTSLAGGTLNVGTLNVGSITVATAASAPADTNTYLLNENFEGTGTPSGWTVSSGAKVDFDYATSPAPLSGAQSLQVQSTDNYARFDFTAQSEVWGKFIWRSPSTLGTDKIMAFRDSSGAEIFKAQITGVGTYYFQAVCGTGTADTAAAISTDTTYYVWVYYKSGSGANAGYRIWFSTTDSKPADGSTSSAGDTNGSRTTNAERIYLTSANLSNNYLFDDAKVAASAIP